MYFTLVPTAHVHLVWPTVGPMLERALKVVPGRFTGGDIYTFCSEGRQNLWVACNDDNEIVAAITTRLYDLPLSRVCSIEWVGGDQLAEWIGIALVTLENYARDAGCGFIEGHGRSGWEKILAKSDWSKYSVSYCKKL